MRKELLVYIATNEEGEECKVQRVAADTDFFLFTLGQQRMVLNIHELMEAVSSIDRYSTMFDQEQMMKDMRAKAPPLRVVETPVLPIKGGKRLNPEDEGALIIEAQMRTGPTASELALEAQTKHMQGETLVVTDKKED